MQKARVPVRSDFGFETFVAQMQELFPGTTVQECSPPPAFVAEAELAAVAALPPPKRAPIINPQQRPSDQQLRAQAAANALKIPRVFTEEELLVAQNLAAPATELSAELVEISKMRNQLWAAESMACIEKYKFPSTVKHKYQVSPAAAHYAEVYNAIVSYFGGTLEGVFISAEELEGNTVALFRKYPATADMPERIVQLRCCSTPKSAKSHPNFDQMAVNFEYLEKVERFPVGESPKFKFVAKSNGHLPVIHAEDYALVMDKVKQLTTVESCPMEGLL